MENVAWYPLAVVTAILFPFFWTAVGFIFEWSWRTWRIGMWAPILLTGYAVWYRI